MSFQESETYLTAPQIRKRFGGRSDVWLWRLLNDERANFPKPVVVRRCRYFPLSEIEAWEASNRAPSKQEVPNA
jgi:predicted DNA-binding transcriptional regulator AlpA